MLWAGLCSSDSFFTVIFIVHPPFGQKRGAGHGGQQHKDDDVHPKLTHQRPDAHDTQRDHELPRGNSEHVNEKADVLTEHQILRIEVGGQRGQRNDGDQDSLERVQQWAEN